MEIFQEKNSIITVRTRDNKPINLRKEVKSIYNIKTIFSFVDDYQKLKLIIQNKKYQILLDLDYNIEHIKKKSKKYIIGKRNGEGKEYCLDRNRLLFSGNYLTGKRNGKGKEYYSNGKLKFEGEYLNGKKLKDKGYDTKGNLIFKLEKSGNAKEYYINGNLKFKGEYLNEIRWNGKGYNINGDLEFEIKNAEGTVKEYDICGFLEYEG